MNEPSFSNNQSALDVLWQKLADFKLVEGARPGIATTDSPWYVKALLALSGWVAALLLIGFIGSVFVFVIKHAFASILVGAVLVALALYLLKKPNNDFLSHLALAFSLAGQGLIVWGILEPLHDSPRLCALIIGAIEILLTIIMPSFVHRVFSSFTATCALYVGFALVANGGIFFSPLAEALIVAIIAFVMSWLWLNEFRFAKNIAAVTAAAYGLTLSLLSLKSTALFGVYTHSPSVVDQQFTFPVHLWLGEILLIAVLVWVVSIILRNMKNVPTRVTQTALIGALLIGFASIKAPGIAIGILITLLGFNNSNQVLKTIGIVALLGYISRYYYFLESTLATKAGILFLLGVVLLTLRFVLLRISKANLPNPGTR